MNNMHKSQGSAPQASSSLYSMAKAITRFIFGEVQLPPYLSHYAAFFTGLATGAAAASRLHKYLARNKRDRAKVQLAVYHIIRLFERLPDHQAALQRPQQLLERMEPEVLRMVGKHLTMDEAAEVTSELKRAYEGSAAEDHVRKRVRVTKRDVVREGMGPGSFPANSSSPRGFLSDIDPGRVYGNADTQEYGLLPPQPAIEAQTQRHVEAPRSDTPIEDEDRLTSDQKQLEFELHRDSEDMMDIDDPSSPAYHGSITTPCPIPAQRSAAPSPESSPAPARIAPTPTPARKCGSYDADIDVHLDKDTDAPKTSAKAKAKRPVKKQSYKRAGGGYGYDPNDLDFYSSSSEKENSPPLSPLSADDSMPSWLEQSFQESEATTLRGNHTDPPSRRALQSSPAHPPPVIAMVGGLKRYGSILSPIAEGGSVQGGSSSPPSTEECQGTSTPIPRLPASVQAIADWPISPVPTYSSSEKDATPTTTPCLRAPALASTPSPTTTPHQPLKRGRARGRAPRIPLTPPAQNSARTPGPRKSSRKTAYGGVYTK
ncbi:hypothetical protein EJ07DRAFT_152100 [Lizonia empirigonia]|nr:hypothetical protein EJ07DRAFT_152100 [Lizonia empirigonia]